MASKSLSLSLSDVNSCLWLVNVAHAQKNAVVELDLDSVLVGEDSRYVFSPSGDNILIFIPSKCYRVFQFVDVLSEMIFECCCGCDEVVQHGDRCV